MSCVFYTPVNANKEIHPMGHGVGIFTEKELKSLTPRQRALLKKKAVQHLRLSPAIHKLITGRL